ncbi:cytosol aminopeptidase [Halyomorpha halys]|uniref:cytosol aminopeptidase n=1 Tax=Halyomorpha halys TaxID=286706 RepID=UPI0006D50112|nr:cytosol aminopeptidase-like [Halyomorpha halys]
MLCTNRVIKRYPWALYAIRHCSSLCDSKDIKRGLLLGMYEGCNQGEYVFTPAAAKFDQENGGRIMELLKGTDLKAGDCRVFHNLGTEFYAIAMTCCGPESMGFNEVEMLNECKEGIRIAVGSGVRALEKSAIGHIMVEGFTNSEAAGESASLSVWRWQDMKDRSRNAIEAKVDLHDDPDTDGWVRGTQKGEGQNIARRLSEVPANIMTPVAFSQAALDILCPCGVHVDIRDRDWLEEKKFLAFLTMSKGSCEPPLFLEMSYCGGGEGDKPVVITGKGVTFDSGGLCLRRCEGMNEFRADMAGAAVIVGLLKTLAALAIPININALVPLMENMPGGASTKPGDVLVGMNNKTIRVEQTDHEGRVIMADTLSHANAFNPCLTINLATMTEGIRTALGSSATGTFTESDTVWREMAKAGADTGDRVWRMPLWNFFRKRVKGHTGVDVHNVGAGRGATPCLGAAFLSEFAPPVDFVHMDLMGTGMESGGTPIYLRKGLMTGRPTRTLFQFLNQMACPLDKESVC